MKKILLGMLLMFLLNFSARLVWYQGLDQDNNKLVDVGYKITEILQGSPIIEVVTRRCVRNPWGSDGQTTRDYFECNTVQIYLSDILFGQEP